jgi:PST family polysaccharide transporter
VIVALGNTLADGAFAAPLVQRREISQVHVSTALWSSVAFAVIMIGSLASLAPVLESFFGFAELAVVLMVISPILLLKSISSVGQALLQRGHRFGAITVAAVSSQIAGYVIPATALAVYGFGLWSLVIGHLVASALEAMLLFAFSRFRLWPAFSRAALGEILAFGGFYTLGRLANWGATQIDNIIVARVLGAGALGLYSRAYSLMTLASLLLGDPASQALFPAFSRMQSDVQGVRSRFMLIFGAALPFYLAVSAFMILHGRALVQLLLGPQWLDAALPLQLLFLAFAARVGYKFSDSLLLALGHSGQVAVRHSAYCAIIAFSAWIGSGFGIAGVALAVSLSIWIFYLVSLMWVSNLLSISKAWLLVVHGRGMLVAAAAASVDLGVQAGFSLANFWLAQAAGAMAFGVLGLMLACYGPSWLVGAEIDTMRQRILTWRWVRPPRPS